MSRTLSYYTTSTSTIQSLTTSISIFGSLQYLGKNHFTTLRKFQMIKSKHVYCIKCKIVLYNYANINCTMSILLLFTIDTSKRTVNHSKFQKFNVLHDSFTNLHTHTHSQVQSLIVVVIVVSIISEVKTINSYLISLVYQTVNRIRLPSIGQTI